MKVTLVTTPAELQAFAEVIHSGVCLKSVSVPYLRELGSDGWGKFQAMTGANDMLIFELRNAVAQLPEARSLEQPSRSCIAGMPRCKCDELSTQRTVKSQKNGNRGKTFFCCARGSRRGGGCDFFQWCVDSNLRIEARPKPRAQQPPHPYNVINDRQLPRGWVRFVVAYKKSQHTVGLGRFFAEDCRLGGFGEEHFWLFGNLGTFEAAFGENGCTVHRHKGREQFDRYLEVCISPEGIESFKKEYHVDVAQCTYEQLVHAIVPYTRPPTAEQRRAARKESVLNNVWA